MDKKGFTLIEVLAIIIVLGIIAVITVPVITKTLDDSRKNVAKESAYGYVNAVNKLYYSKSLNREGRVEDGIYTVSELKTLGVSINGKEPLEGWVELEESEVVSFSIKIGDYVITKYRNSEIVCEKGDIQENEETRAMRIAQTQALTEVQNYIDALLADTTIQGYTKDTSKKVSEISTPTAPTGIDTNSWVYFKKETSRVTAPDYSIKITIGDYIFVVNSVDGTISSPIHNGELLPQKKPAPSFVDDSWTDIKANLAANRNAYPIGSTKIIEFDRDNNGTNEYYKLRLVNTAPCGDYTGSRTSCGVVIEFVTTIGTHNMNSTITNDGGWYASGMRSYLNTETGNIFSKLPGDLQSIIIPTAPIISGSGSGGVSNNIVATTGFDGDKLYLLSGKEIGSDFSDDNRSADTKTLKYYVDNIDYYSKKKYSTTTSTGTDSSASLYWLRSATSRDAYSFFGIDHHGYSIGSEANDTDGVAPAFRILD